MNGWETFIGSTKIFITKAKLRNASGFVSILAGTASDLLDQSSGILGSANTNQYPIKFG